MRINEYNNLDEFKSQYCGWWDPSDGKWLGLEFKYNNKFYRLHTGPMFEKKSQFYLTEKKVNFAFMK